MKNIESINDSYFPTMDLVTLVYLELVQYSVLRFFFNLKSFLNDVITLISIDQDWSFTDIIFVTIFVTIFNCHRQPLKGALLTNCKRDRINQ